MKRETLRNGLILSVLGMTFCLSTAIMVTSCQKQSFDDAPIAPQSAQSRAAEELPYLDFTTEYTGVGVPSDQDWEVIMEVSKRVKFSKPNGLWEMDIHSASEINVSPNVFTFLVQTVERSNAQIVSHLSVMSVAPRVRKPGGGEGPDLLEQESSNCVARCFGWIHKDMGFGPSYDTSNSWINDRFGAGVPADSMEFTLQHFYGADHVSSFPVNDQPVGSKHINGNSVVILNYKVNDSTGHAVIYRSTGDGVHWAIDPSKNSDNPPAVIVDSAAVISSFKITK